MARPGADARVGQRGGAPVTRNRAVGTGAVIVVGYLLAILGTSGTVRPLLDGFAPAPEYHWVEPPAYFSPGNRAPTGLTATIPVRDGVSTTRGLTTPDGQVVLTLGRGAIEAPRGDQRIRLRVEPRVGPASLPDGLRANGNAYRITMTAEPSGTVITTLARPGTLVLQVPELSTGLFQRLGHTRWQPVPSMPIPPRQLSLTTPLDQSGDYVSGTNLPLLAGPEQSADHTMIIALGIGAVTLVVLGAAAWTVRRRRAAAAVSPSAGTRDPDRDEPDLPSES